MFSAIVEISLMLLGALGIGIYIASQYWKNKLKASEDTVNDLRELLLKAEIQLKKDKSRFKDLHSEMQKKIDAMTKLNTELEERVQDQEKRIKEGDLKMQKQQEQFELLEETLQETIREMEALSASEPEPTPEIVEVESKSEKKVAVLAEPAPVKKKAKKKSQKKVTEVPQPKGYYEIIDGKKYDAAVLEATRTAVAGQGDGRISMTDAAHIYAVIEDANRYTDVEKDTIKFIRDNFRWTESADNWFRTTVRSWAAKRGWETRKED